MIIDCHTHINNYHDEASDSLRTCVDNLQLEMRRNRIDIALVLTSYKINPGRPSTRATIEATRGRKHIRVVAGLAFATLSPPGLEELRQDLQQGSIRGLKLYPGYEPFFPNDPALEPVYALAQEFQVPVMLHSGDTFTPKGKLKYAHPLNIDEVAVDHPGVDFIICHLGNPWIRDCMEVVYKNKNVYTDISGLVLGDFTDRFESFMRKQLQEMLEYGVEPDKVLFGTDWPLASMESYLEFIQELSIPERERRKIMWENAARLFKLSQSDSLFATPSTLAKFKAPNL
jgi:predicted TIM-barrel fold metal-dependent hydrolase